MITQRFILKEYNWAITVLLDCNCSDIFDIKDHLKSIDCPNYYINIAIQNLDDCEYDKGNTYSNYKLRRTVMTIGKASSLLELYNTIAHEIYHFVSQLHKANVTEDEEKEAILCGDLYMNIFSIVQDNFDI